MYLLPLSAVFSLGRCRTSVTSSIELNVRVFLTDGAASNFV